MTPTMFSFWEWRGPLWRLKQQGKGCVITGQNIHDLT